jgi:hypothetical protein
MTNLVALHNQLHQGLRVDTQSVEAYGGQLHMVPVVLSEFLKLAVQFPIAVTKNKETGQFVCVAIFGFQPGENLFIKDARWDSLYLPLQIKRQPFFLGSAEGSADDYVICIDRTHKSLQANSGEAIFDTQGNDTAYMQNIKAILAELVNGEAATQTFIKALSDMQLLQAMHLDIKFNNGETIRVEGIYTVNEQRLRSLDKDDLFKLHNQDWLAPIYTMITSLGHIHGLVERKNKCIQDNQLKESYE